MKSADLLQALEKSPLFSGVDKKILTELLAGLTLEQRPKNLQIVSPAQTAKRFSVIIEGRVKIVRSNDTDGREFNLFLLGPGDGFDIVSLLDGKPNEVSAWTLDEVTVLTGPMSRWRACMDRHPELRLGVERYAATQLRALADLASDLALHDTMTRLVRLLLRHFDTRRGATPRISLIRDLPHEELARLIGTVRVVVNRMLAELRREGVITYRQGELRVANLKRLLRKAESAVVAQRRQGQRQSMT